MSDRTQFAEMKGASRRVTRTLEQALHNLGNQTDSSSDQGGFQSLSPIFGADGLTMTFSRSSQRSFHGEPSEWKMLFGGIWKRTHKPFGQPTYVFFFLVSMVLGGIGIWTALAEAWLSSQPPTESGGLAIWANTGVFKSVITFFAALGSASCAQVLMIEDRDKHLRSLFLILLIVFVALAILAAMFGYQNTGSGYPYAIMGIILATFTWWIANWDDSKFGPSASLDPLGGELTNAVAGDTEGFTV